MNASRLLLMVALCSGTLAAQAPSSCQKSVAFAVFEGGQASPRVPVFTEKWVAKNQKKFPDFCFSQEPAGGPKNYLLVFAISRSVFNGIYPTVRTSTNTDTTPVSGTGTVTDNYGGMWTYTYTGTETTTTTTRTPVNLPYTDTSNTLYLLAYRWNGTLSSYRWRTITTRQGGDGANTLGYNLGAALGAIHLKQRLLADVLKDVDADCDHGRSTIGACGAQVTVNQSRAVVPVTAPAVAEPARPDPSTAQAQLQILSTPDGADIEIDGAFVGNTPSTVGVSAGQHEIAVKKSGFKPWDRKINVSSGQVNVNATLEAEGR